MVNTIYQIFLLNSALSTNNHYRISYTLTHNNNIIIRGENTTRRDRYIHYNL